MIVCYSGSNLKRYLAAIDCIQILGLETDLLVSIGYVVNRKEIGSNGWGGDCLINFEVSLWYINHFLSGVRDWIHSVVGSFS